MSTHSLFRRGVTGSLWAILICLLGTLPAIAQTTTLSITPITWGVVGLDSNKPVTSGPDLFLEGARVCNTGSVQATGVEATWAWTSSNPYIDLQNPGGQFTNPLLVQQSYGVLDPSVSSDVAQSVLDPGQCFDFYFNVELQRNSAAFYTSRQYNITATASNETSSVDYLGQGLHREVYVEELVSQNRNTDIQITGPSSVWVGGIFHFTMTGATATNGYEQLEQHVTFPNTVFQVISSSSSFSVGSPTTSTYADACGWDADYTSATYNSCLGTGKAGGSVTQDYYAKIMALPSGSSTLVLNGVIYDYSGSSFHYNSDYNGGGATLTTTVSPTPTRADFGAIDAIRRGDAITLRWDTSHESNNLGFYVWREVNGEKTRITSTPIAGSAFLAGPTIQPTGGAYGWIDDVPANVHPVYWIEALDLDGSSHLAGPITPRDAIMVDDPLPGRRRPVMLRDLARARSTFASEHAIGASIPPVASARAMAKSQGATLSSFDLAGSAAAKITVRRDGWTRVTGSRLEAAGVASRAKSSGLRLFADGREVPIVVDDGGDGRLDAGDSISFYGTALDTPWADGHVYWLLSGSKPGARAEVSSVQGASDLSATSFPFTVERKDRLLYFAALGGKDTDNFFGPMISTVYGPATQSLNVTHLDPSGTMATLAVRLQGVSSSTSSQQDHRVRVDVNGTPVGEVVFDGRDNVTRSFGFPASMLHDGSNVVTLTATRAVNDPVNWYVDSLVDRVDLTYPHTYDADADWLAFSAPGLSLATVRGFSSPDVTAVDVTDPTNPIVLASSVSANDGVYDLTVSTPDGGPRVVVAVTASGAATPSSVVANQPSSWNSRKNSADFVIITSRSMMDEAARLATRRESQGWRVAIVDVTDIYDEFDYGAESPYAIKDFLSYAYSNWHVAPGYVLLLGDASLDPRNYLGYPDSNIVPTYLMMTAYSQAASDEWLVDFDGDGVGEMAIGRLPADTPAQADVMISKTLEYESTPPTGWDRTADIMAGPNDPPGLNNFVSAADRLATAIPRGFDLKKDYSDALGPAQARANLLGRWSDGSGIVSYFGHGYAFGWGLGTTLFSTGDATALQNRGRLPVVEAMTCLSGWFYNPAPWARSMAEALLENPNGGAVAVWASSGSTTLEYQVPAAEAFTKALAADHTTLGEANRRGKRAAFDGDIRHTWILFGDPTLTLSGN